MSRFYRGLFLLVCVAVATLILLDAFASAADLPVPRKAKVSVAMTREKGPAPVYEPPKADRPVGMP